MPSKLESAAMTDAPDRSPDLLSERPRAPGMRRLNRAPLLFAGLVAALLMGAVAYTYHVRVAAQRQAAALEKDSPEPPSAIGVLNGAPDRGLIAAKETALPPSPQPPIVETKVEPENEARKLAWEEYRQKLARLKEAREQATLQAVLSPTSLGVGSATRPPTVSASSLSQAPDYASLGADRVLRRVDALDDRDRDLNRAQQKRDFLMDRPAQSLIANTLAVRREDPQSPYEVKAGTIIPAVMIGGASSDLPGLLLGQVTQNVYDTATGRFILIPQGAKLIGVYDNAVTTGQERVLAAWTRIIYPDGSSLDLGKMPGTDQSGYAGFHDQVDNHLWKTFGNALLLSAFSSGVQLSQGQGNSQTSGLTAQQTIAASLGQQLGQLGQEMARRNMQVQPTLEIRPGYRFTVMVTKDLILRPWRAQ
jgi:type IV secretion system protein TrbI